MRRSLYASPGCRAFGFDSVLDDRFGRIYTGLHVAKAARTGFVELVRMPCWGMGTIKNREKGGGKDEEHLMLGLAIVYPPGEPDKPGVLGLFAHNGASVQKYHSDYRLRPKFSNERDSLWLDDFFMDLVPLCLFDPGVTVHIGRSEQGLSAMSAQQNVFVLNGALIKNDKERMVFAVLATGVSIEVVLELLRAAHRELPPDLGVLPATGSVPAVPSFRPIASDIFSVGSKDYRVGGAPDQMTGGAMFQLGEETRLGVLQRRPWLGTVELRVLRSVHDFSSELELDEAWLVLPRAQVLTTQVVWVEPEALRYPIKVVPPSAFHAARLDSSVAYPLALVADSDGMVRALEAPLSRAAALSTVLAAAPVGDKAAAKETLFQEVRSQTVPENQESLSEAVTELRGCQLGHALTLVPRLAAGWRGDRAGTLEYVLTEAELTTLLTHLGWSVPDPPPDKLGRDRKRYRNKGFLLILPESRGRCRVTYGLESKSFKLITPLSLFGEDLDFVKGVQPPEAPDKVYDIVSFKLRALTAEPPRSLARARAAFDPLEYGGMAM